MFIIFWETCKVKYIILFVKNIYDVSQKQTRTSNKTRAVCSAHDFELMTFCKKIYKLMFVINVKDHKLMSWLLAKDHKTLTNVQTATIVHDFWENNELIF